MKTHNQFQDTKRLLEMSPQDLKITLPGTYFFSLWIVPNRINYHYFEKIINDLSYQFNAPNFQPHVTVYTGICTEKENLKEVILRSISMYQNITLNIKGIGCSNNFFRSLYVDFGIDPILLTINKSISERMKYKEHYELQPHLSLMYNNMTMRKKLLVKKNIKLQEKYVTFDSIRVVVPGNLTKGWTDVAKWKTIVNMTFK